MIENVLVIILIILAMLGLSDLLHDIRLWLVRPKNRALKYSIVFLGCDPVQQIKASGEEYLWSHNVLSDYIITVGDNLDSTTAKECREVAEAYGIIYCEVSELSGILQSLLPKSTETSIVSNIDNIKQ